MSTRKPATLGKGQDATRSAPADRTLLPKLFPVLVVAAGLLAYHNSLNGPFILDDRFSIVDNRTIRHLWPLGKVLLPPADSMVGGRPVVNLSFAVNYALGGLNVWGYHVFNLAVHLLAGLTLYGIVYRVLRLPRLTERFRAASGPLALAVAVLWTVHPLQTGAVTYISQRCESLMGLLYLLTLYCFLRGTEAQRPGRWFALSVAACVLGMASKEVMVTAPVMVLLADRTFVAGSFQEAWKRRWRLYVALAAPWVLLAGLMSGVTVRAVNLPPGVRWPAYALTECRAVAHYLRLAVWPHPLVFDYGIENMIVRNAAQAVPAALLLLLLGLAVLGGLVRRPAIGFLGAWVFVILAPSSSLLPVGGSPMAEHRMYLSLAGVVAAAVVGAYALGKRVFNGQQGAMTGWLAGGTLAVALAWLTIQRNRDYGSELSIWRDTVEKCPDNARAHNDYGFHLSQAGDVPDAIREYEQALQLQPDYAEAQTNLGNALAASGRIAEAIARYQQALRINPRYAEAHLNWGAALAQQGRIPEAIGQYEQALQAKPDSAQAHLELGLALALQGRNQEARDHCQEAVRLEPDSAEAHYSLGLALEQLGRNREAIAEYQEALRLKPDFTPANEGLARLQNSP